MPSGSFILRPNTCTRWVRCPTTVGSHEYEEGSCVEGLFYNKDSGRCEDKKKVSCPYSEKETQGKNRCNGQNEGIFLEDPRSCRSYVYCSQGQELRANCPMDLVFNPNISSCVYPRDYKCKDPVDGNIMSPICRSLPNKIKFADKLDCSKYNQCIDGQVKDGQCKKDQGFDHVKGECVPLKEVVCFSGSKQPEPENLFCGTKKDPKIGYFSDEQSCSGFYICAEVQADGTPDRNPVHLKCESGYFFDADKLSCRDRLNVKCNFDRCEGMGDKYVNIAGDCSSYARCSKGVRVGSGKCPTSYFFDEQTQGCTPINKSYAACSA